MIHFDLIDFAEASRLLGISEAEISSRAMAGKVIVVRENRESEIEEENPPCEMIGVRAAAKRAGCCEQKIRDYADAGKIYCLVVSSNRYRKIWSSDADAMKAQQVRPSVGTQR